YGFLLNNELTDFDFAAPHPNVPEAGKRPRSSMAPTIALRDGKPAFSIGSPGGSTIITTVLQVIMNMVDHGMNVAEASTAPRIHHQWLPDELRVEEGISLDTIRILQAKGHDVAVKEAMGSTQSIMRDPQTGTLYGASDPRRPDAATLGY
ncbi:gamma-glutamyltransferase, partial [Paracoccus sp. (in: a-proteobacteria)]|uniref:gamma-glutamyltransferase n=1 Tax=Paracoccus sp. TaxID=267 RepID=UPI0028AF8BDF